MTEKLKKLSLFLGFLLVAGGFWGTITIKKADAYYGNPALSQTSVARHAEYLIVYNSDNVAHEVGDILVFFDGTNDGLEVSTTTTANNALVAGVVAIRDIAATTWGIMQTRGYHAAVTVGVATSAGDALVTSTTGEAAGVFTVTGTTTTTGTAATSTELLNYRGVKAIALEATTSSTTVKAFLR